MDRSNSDRTDSRRIGVVIIVTLVATVARIVACWYWSAELSGDPDGYLGLTQRLIGGAGFVSPTGNPTAYRPVLYPLMLAGVVWAGPMGVAVLHIVLGVGTVLLTLDLGRRLGLGRWSVLAGLFVALNPLLLRYAPQVMTETTCALWAVLLLDLFAAGNEIVRREAPAAHLAGGAASLSLGIVIGLAVLARPTFWAVVVLLGLDAVLRFTLPHSFQGRFRFSRTAESSGQGRTSSARGCAVGRHPKGCTPTRAPGARQRALLILLGLALVVAPWAIRNAFALGTPRLMTTHGGYTLLLANNPIFWREVVLGPPGATWQRESLTRWQETLEEKLAVAGIAPTDEIARDRWMRRRAIGNIVTSPVLFLRATAYRLGRFWAIWPLRPAQDLTSQRVRELAALDFAGGYALAALGMLGWLLSGARGLSGAVSWRAVLWLVLGFVLVHAVFWTDARMRAPLVPALGLLAALGARETWHFLRAASK